MKMKLLGMVICSILIAMAILVIAFPIMYHSTEFGSQERSLVRVQQLDANDVDSIVLTSHWTKKTVFITGKQIIVYFLTVCREDLFMDKLHLERGQHLMYDQITIRLKKPRSNINLNYWLSSAQNGDRLVSLTVRSRSEFKGFIKEVKLRN